jgi:hypothetical protein
MKLSWSNLKNIIDTQRLSPMYFESEAQYKVFVVYGTVEYYCLLDKSPSDTTDLDDFLNNYKDYSNTYFPPVITPTVIRNEFQLEPEGLHCRRIDLADYSGTITLSNKDGLTYTYTQTLSDIPIHENCLWYFDTDGYFKRVYVDSATVSTITLEDEIPEGTYNISKKVTLDYKVTNDQDIHYLWGILFSTSSQGKYDFAVMEILDPDTYEELLRYDECWVSHINQLVKFTSPDGSPAEVYNYILRVDYYYCDDNFSGNILKADYIITRKD